MYPSFENAPDELKQLSGPCGPISVWMILVRYKISINPQEIITRCKYTNENGCYAVCMADALQQFGLNICFHTDLDPAPNFPEKESYLSVDPQSALSISSLLENIRQGASVIVSYQAYCGEGHFSPLAGSQANKLLLPYSVEGSMLKSEFNKRWRADGVFRQAIIVANNC